MPASKDTKLPLDFNDRQPCHAPPLNTECSPRQPIRFTSKSLLADILATPAKGATKTPRKAVEARNRELNVEVASPSRANMCNNRSIVTGKAKATEPKVLKHTTGSIARNNQLPVAVTPTHNLKRKLSSITSTGVPNKGMANHDPANHEIKRLREEKGLKWGQIADILNKQLIAQGKRPAFTHNGVYSRYTRNAPRIAAMEAWPSGQVRGILRPSPSTYLVYILTRDFQEEMLVRAYHEVQAEMLEELWHRVSAKIVEAGGEKIAPDACAFRYNSL
ncbi:MAG: hypothetical protein M1813_009047 [Trichoglossum hirsutum]|nr:MAG: hypothetical protein M1813_009047 [Trichoglossum hirsutum]